MVEVQQLGLRELLELAQTALEEGRHQEATISCRHVLREYPESATAMRLLGESYLEAGRTDEAGRAFEKVLTLDPFNVLARVGLGVLAEDRGDDERAIGQFRLAWETAPHLPQLRSELVRLYRKRYGVGGRLRMTRVALANLHAHNEDLPRAIRQFQLLHTEAPERVDVAVALAEARWRHGDDEDAAIFCRQLVAAQPSLARPLLILAAILGDDEAANAEPGKETVELLTRARAFDPDTILARDLATLRPSPTLQRFIDAPTAMAPFDPAFLDVAGTDELLGQSTNALGTDNFRWEDIAGGMATETTLSRDPGPGVPAAHGDTNGSVPAASEEDDVEALFAAIDRQLTTTKDPDLASAPVAERDDALALAGDDADLSGGWDMPQDDGMTPAPDELTAVELLTANWDNIDNELAAARPDDTPLGVTGVLSALGDMEDDLQPFNVESDAEPELEATLTFDPSKFSLPPLDGEDDDDFPLDLDTGDLSGDIAPFNLDETAPKVKTTGLTFADLVRNEEQAPITYTAGNSFADAVAGEDDHLADIASIFATRELTPLPEDRLLGLQATPTETLTTPEAPSIPREITVAPPDDAPVGPPASAQTTAPPTFTAEPLATETAPAAALHQAEATESGPARPGPERRRDPAAAISFEALLGADTPRLELPEATYFPDATRPLLADDPLLFDLSATMGPVVSTAVGAAEPTMDSLFDRLRNRKQERIETGDLQVNRRLEVAPRPALIPASDTAQTTAAPAEEHAHTDTPTATSAADTPIPTTDPATPLAVEAADLDDWIMSLAPVGPDANAHATTTDPDQTATPAGDDWLAGLVEGAHTGPPAQASAPPTTAAETGANGASAARDWGLPLANGRADTAVSPPQTANGTADEAAADAAVAHDWATAAPEQPEPFAPFASRLAGEDESDTVQPTWADEVPERAATPETPPSGDDRLIATSAAEAAIDMPTPPSRDTAADPTPGVYTNGHHAPVDPPPAPLVFSASLPAVTPAERAAFAARRQTAQLASLVTIVEADPQNHFARLTLAVAYSSLQPEQALNEYRRLIKESDDVVPEVIERLKEMIADGEAPPRAHRVLGDAYMKMGRFDMAMAEFQRALSARTRAPRA